MAENGDTPTPIDLGDLNITNDEHFRLFCVRQFQLLADAVKPLADMKKKVDKHERAYTGAKALAAPIVVAYHSALWYGLKHWFGFK